MKLYAYITLIFENMTKNPKNEGKSEFFDKKSRDIFGDYVCQMKKSDFDIAIRQSGDFLLYFDSIRIALLFVLY